MTTYFISGHLDLTLDEFHEHYRPKLTEAIAEGASFVVGDALGADWLSQALLKRREQQLARHGCEVIVYHMLESPRHNEGFPTCGGFKSDKERDMAMTAASDADIAWVRPGREKSGTAKNLKRRHGTQQPNR